MTRLLLYPEWLIDGTGADAARGQAVVIAAGRFERIAPAAALVATEDDEIVRLDGMTLIPGLINNHVHLNLPGDNTPFTPWIDLQTDAALALWSAHNSAVSLRSGVTTVRDCGGRGTTVLDTRDAQAGGRVSGAHIIACGWPLTISGGHTRHFGGEVDNEDGIRTMVRRVVSKGADFVKVMASGGGTPGSLSQYPSFTVAELRTLVETAHGLGRKVSAHCIATASIANAVEAGVDMIEHASFYGPDLVPHLDPRVADLLAEAAIPVTPTLQVARDMVDLLPDGPERDLWRQRQEAHHAIVRTLHARGVPMLAGSDAGWRATAFDTFGKELEELIVCGLSVPDAIHAATGGVTRALGYSETFGTIQPGQRADLVAVAGNLATDIHCLTHVSAVMQAGARVYP
jgi:imidazolonepropionase-like amidohydrolase